MDWMTVADTVSESLRAAFVDRYDVERELGHGGMATVYLARDRKHDRLVALKVLRPDLVSSLGAGRFLREIAIASHLAHPHILTLIDSGETTSGGFLYYVMPFAEGESLRDRLTRDGPLPIPQAIRLLREVADALAYAHKQGVVHRDIKPDNVLLLGEHAVVVDFGIAKAIGHARHPETMTGTGVSIGTPTYMAPEQAAGDPNVDSRADIYAVGILAYEMIAGRPPFVGTPQSVLASHITAVAPPLDSLRKRLPTELSRCVMRCLEKDPTARYQTADELVADLDRIGAPVARGRSWIAATVVAVAAVTILMVMWKNRRDERWVHQTAIPTIRRYADIGSNDSAFALAERASAMMPDDTVLRSLWPSFSRKAVLHSSPEGATVTRAAVSDTTRWVTVGTTPTDTVRVPTQPWYYRFEKPGFHTATLFSARPGGGANVPLPKLVSMRRIGAPDSDMVQVSAGNFGAGMPGLDHLRPLELGDFLIDRFEVTNRQYKRFVDAGGYAKSEQWDVQMMRDGKPVRWEDGVRLFVDRTGRPGPATWEAGAPLPGQEDFPVGGVSWYEAKAYARFAGKDLPSFYEWSAAAVPPSAGWIMPASNFDSHGPVRGGTLADMSPWGVYDMGGNVREWCANEDGEGKRYILGGGWSDPSYMFIDSYAQQPIDRSPINGIRLIRRLANHPNVAKAVEPIRRELRDFTRETPVSDAQFANYREMFEYDRTPLNARIEKQDATPPEWIKQRVSFDATYGGERVSGMLYLPKAHQPPFQTIVLFPSSIAFNLPSSDELPDPVVDYFLRSGRAVFLPVLKGTFERKAPGYIEGPEGTVSYRDHVLLWGKDLRRSVDYLSSRPEIDSTRIALSGTSWGGAMGGLMMGLEPRFRAGILVVAGFPMSRPRPEVDVLNFLPRVRAPVIMLNAKYDHFFPQETSQKPYFRWLGTPPADKKLVMHESGHFLLRSQMIGESLAWLDHYLGPVTR
ncbi:MAG: serine/threonine protein kinase [Gemmatimonadetes bacterium]|nr:serine/threonine protein kinase [Gemmatimonadota bacterium]